LWKRFDQPHRHALEAAGQKRDAGRDEEDADGLLDPANCVRKWRKARMNGPAAARMKGSPNPRL
jgi:hypothetical protein